MDEELLAVFLLLTHPELRLCRVVASVQFAIRHRSGHPVVVLDRFAVSQWPMECLYGCE